MYKNKYMKYKAKYLKLIGGMEKSIEDDVGVAGVAGVASVESKSIFPKSLVVSFSHLDGGYEMGNHVILLLQDESLIDITTTTDNPGLVWGIIDFDEEKLDGLKDCIIVSIDQINRSESNEYDGTDIIKFDIAITFMNKHNIAKKILLPVKYEDTSGYGEYDLWLDVNINKK